ncbi:hypothetical protein LEMLEM_LOCUS9311 [Lemmus lemmus]
MMVEEWQLGHEAARSQRTDDSAWFIISLIQSETPTRGMVPPRQRVIFICSAKPFWK